MMMINAFNTLQQLHQNMKKLETKVEKNVRN